VKAQTGRGDIFYRITLPKSLIEALNWNRYKTFYIASKKREIILSPTEKSSDTVTLTKAVTKEIKRKKHYSYTFLVPMSIVKKFKITEKNKAQIRLHDQRLVLSIR
jgi:bifunctional DNA-binding transcriptional regulator/antitoxin component of YhaV-PrlF toxin-antitoxin module